jgi:flagellar biosynthesis/type III secretory pathway M-ring protein FliF/YscJ
MEFIKKQLEQIKEHLGTLTTSQRLVIYLLVVIIFVALFWTVYQTSSPSMTPLFEQTLTDSELASYENKLELWDITYRVEGGKILVKRQELDRILARLGQNNALPSDMSESWKKLILDSDMWISQEDRQNRWKLALEQRLGQIIQLMDGVQNAYVIINTGSKKLFSDGPSSDPSASVYLNMKSGEAPSKALVLAVAGMVSGAVDRLSRQRVQVIANGAPCRVPDENSPYSLDALDARRDYERHFADKIQQVLAITNAQVGVFVELETETIQTTEQKYGDPIVSREHTMENTSEPMIPKGEPGVRPNTGISVQIPEASGQKSTQTENDTEYQGSRDLTQIVKHKNPGEVKTIRATVNIPYSYFVGIFQAQTGKTDKPTEAQLEPIIKAQEENISKKVLPIINATDPTFVEVSYFYDLPTTIGSATALAASGPTSLPDLMKFAKPAGLVVLAFASLLMVLMMMKKASSNVSIQNLEQKLAAQVEPTPTLEGESGPVGEASSTEGVLEGIEVDEHTLRARKMAEQVATLVKEDPGSAASLIRQWIIKSR